MNGYSAASAAPTNDSSIVSLLVNSTSTNANSQQRSEHDQRLARRHPARGDRPPGGALHLRIELAVGVVVDRATGRAHREHAEGEDDQRLPRREIAGRQPQRPPGRPQQQQRADRAIHPDQHQIGRAPCRAMLAAARAAGIRSRASSAAKRPRAAHSARAPRRQRLARPRRCAKAAHACGWTICATSVISTDPACRSRAVAVIVPIRDVVACRPRPRDVELAGRTRKRGRWRASCSFAKRHGRSIDIDARRKASLRAHELDHRVAIGVRRDPHRLAAVEAGEVAAAVGAVVVGDDDERLRRIDRLAVVGQIDDALRRPACDTSMT